MTQVVGRVVVVDDDPDLRYLLCELLGALTVPECRAYGTLVELQQDEAYALAGDLAVLDVNLGVGQPSGIDVCRWLHGRGFAGKIVFLTGHAKSHPLVAEAVHEPGTEVFEKPIGMDKLLKLVERA